MSDIINIVYCSDENYMMPTLVSAASASVFASKECRIVIHLIDGGVEDETFNKFATELRALNRYVTVIRRKWMSHDFDDFPSWHGSRIIYARLVLQDILSDVDWIVSLDGDTLWVGNPLDLMRYKNDRMMFLANKDPLPPNGGVLVPHMWFKANGIALSNDESFCAGLMLINAKKLRETNFTKKAKEFLKKYPNPPCPEQMVFSCVCKGYAAQLPIEWGVFSRYHTDVNLANGGVIHYVSDPPWNRKGRYRLVSDIVLLWHLFAKRFLGKRFGFGVGAVASISKRLIYKILKICHPLIRHSGRARIIFYNMKGLSSVEMSRIMMSWVGGEQHE